MEKETHGVGTEDGELARVDMDATMDTTDAMKRWELENEVEWHQDGEDELYRYDAAEQAAILEKKPWTTDPQYYKHVRVSALALLKMAMHCRSGGDIEVMGLMQGKVAGDTFIVIDTFALPVEGTETRVNAQSEAYEYMVEFMQTQKASGRHENVVGWYHSHPGYGCWLSGIDVSTQMLNQTYQEPFLAIVIDPIRTAAAGKVEIGAFRTFPQGVKPPGATTSEYQTIPLNKIEDFGVHAEEYYTLSISFFKSSLDSHLLRLLWNKYWVSTLSSSPLLMNSQFLAGQIKDLSDKLEQVDGNFGRSSRFGAGLGADQKKDDKPLGKVLHDSKNVAGEHISGQITQLIKHLLFNHDPRRCKGH